MYTKPFVDTYTTTYLAPVHSDYNTASAYTESFAYTPTYTTYV